MTVEELIEELQQLPGAAQIAVVFVAGASDFKVDYRHGQVLIGDDDD